MAVDNEKGAAAGTVTTLKRYFEVKEGETLKDFLVELKQLSVEEKEQMAAGINNGTFAY